MPYNFSGNLYYEIYEIGIIVNIKRYICKVFNINIKE